MSLWKDFERAARLEKQSKTIIKEKVTEILGNVFNTSDLDPDERAIYLRCCGVGYEPTFEQLLQIWKLGAKRLYVDHIGNRGTTYYYEGGPPKGYPKYFG